jgi:hypothetical protein
MIIQKYKSMLCPLETASRLLWIKEELALNVFSSEENAFGPEARLSFGPKLKKIAEAKRL